MEKHIVHCRICKQKLDINDKSVQWCSFSKNWYYHLSCYNNWKTAALEGHMPPNDEFWVDSMYDFLAHTVHMDYNYHMCEKQRESFINKNHYTNKGIYFSLLYFYNVKHGQSDKAYGGIGIVSYIYNEATAYYARKEQEQQGFLAQVERQMKERKIVERKFEPKPKEIKEKKKGFDFSDVEALDD